jgi:DNA-binding IclR family transcriptional regulator
MKQKQEQEEGMERGPESFRTVSRIVRVLELLASTEEPLRLTDVARILKIPFSSTHILLQALVQLELAEFSTNDRRYVLGPRLRRLGVRVVSRLGVLEVARPRIVQLVSRIDEDIYLALYEGASFSHVERFSSSHKLRLDIALGVPRPLHSTAVGKLYLASLNTTELNRLLAQLPLERFTPFTITQPEELRQQLERVRRDGFAVSDQESIEGITSTAAPIYSATGALVAAVTSPIPRSRYLDRKEIVAAAIVETAADISAALGWEPNNISPPVLHQ